MLSGVTSVHEVPRRQWLVETNPPIWQWNRRPDRRRHETGLAAARLALHRTGPQLGTSEYNGSPTTPSGSAHRGSAVDELRRIADQLRRAFEGEAWHGPAVLEVLAGVTPAQAHARPIPGAHTIWELTLHYSGAYRLVLRRLKGDATPLASEEDWPPVPEPTAENWRAAVEGLRALNEDARRAVAGFDPNRLDQPLVADVPYTAYTQFIGLTQHDLYHAGQIAFLKRALAAAEPVAAPSRAGTSAFPGS